MRFKIVDKTQLAKFLAVAPGEIDYVISRLHRFYRPKPIRKPDGSTRMLHVPQGKLVLLQEKIKRHILDEFQWLPCVHGGIKNRSILSNADPHVDKNIVFSLDVKDFFPSVGPNRVFAIFTGLGFGQEPARILTRVTTWKHQLPQGTKTSTALANLSLIRVDWRIERLAERYGFSYTRFVDDLTLSGDWRLLKFRKLVQRILESEGFSVRLSKVRTMPRGSRQTVTKLVVNEKVNATREQRESIRADVLAHIQADNSVPDPRLLGRVYWLRYINLTVGERLAERVGRITLQ
ncbi:MAG TPA: reverse transcriptase family protein [Candidatus Acidoferrales bacterium]|nr:reverse transcriptase family protein [Candidatus Acidoferrales bacterium]